MKTKLANKWKKRKENKENKTKQTIKCFFMTYWEKCGFGTKNRPLNITRK